MKTRYDELEELQSKATPGRWTWKQIGTYSNPGCSLFWPDTSGGGVHYRRLDSNGGMTESDAGYITAVCDAAPGLIADIRELVAALKACEAALTEISKEMTFGERYTNAGQYLLDALPDARAAISRVQDRP